MTSCEGVGLQKTLRFSELTFVPAKDGKHTATLTVRACAVSSVASHLSRAPGQPLAPGVVRQVCLLPCFVLWLEQPRTRIDFAR